MALTLLWRSASICTRAALPRRSIASTLLSRGARQSGAPRIVIGLTAAAAAASAIGAYAYTRSVSEAVLNTNESAHEELELANTEVAKVLHFLPGPRELMSDTSRWLVARLAAVCWWYSARILRTLQLTALFVPVALCAPLLVVQSPHADSIVYNQLLRSMEWSGATLCKLGQWASHREEYV